jgi:hypothetical protein
VRAGLRQAALLALVAAALPGALRAQGDVPVGGVRFLSSLEARSVSFDAGLGIKSATEFAIPIGALWTATPRWAFDFGVRYASATRTPETAGQSKATVSGLTDTQVRAIYQLVPDVVVVTLSANLPTGKTKLTSDELVAAGVMASDLIPFPVASFGNGANVTTGVAVAVPVAGWAVGLGGSYRMTGGYTPLASVDSSYKPGGELRLRMGADRVVGQGRVSLGFTFSTFADDAFGGASIYRPGKRYITQGTWSFPVGNLGLALYAWDLYRNGGTVIVGGSTTEKQNVLTIGAAATVQVGRNVLRPQLEYRIQSAGVSTMVAAGHLLSLSARYQLPLTERLALQPAVRFDTGNQIYNGATIGLTGWGLSVGLRASM